LPMLSSSAQETLVNHTWQGNVRELDNVLQRALILQTGKAITAKDLAFENMANASMSQNPVSDITNIQNLGDDLRSHEQRHIIDALESNNGNRRATAQELGISERTLRYKLSRFRAEGITIPEKVGKKSA
jgi:two-component system response regulator FlrC